MIYPVQKNKNNYQIVALVYPIYIRRKTMLTREGSPKSTRTNKENPNNLKKIPSFFNVVSLWLDTFFK